MLAVVTAVVDAHGGNQVISTSTLTAYRPALDVITGVAVLGVAIALTGLRPPRRQLAVQAVPARAAEPASPAAVHGDDCGDAELEPARG